MLVKSFVGSPQQIEVAFAAWIGAKTVISTAAGANVDGVNFTFFVTYTP